VAPSRTSQQIAFFGILIAMTLGCSQDPASQPVPARRVEKGTFLLHNVLQHTGEERYLIEGNGDSLILTSEFRNADRGTAIPLSASLQTRADLTPERFDLSGRTSEATAVDSSVVIDSGVAIVREGGRSKQVPVPAAFLPYGAMRQSRSRCCWFAIGRHMENRGH